MMSRGLIIRKDEILLIHRFKHGREYYVIPGGHVEPGESYEQALIREIKEETNLDVQINKKLWVLSDPYNQGNVHFYLITKFSGNDIKISGGPELDRQCEDNQYILEWHKIKDVQNLTLYPEGVKEKIELLY